MTTTRSAELWRLPKRYPIIPGMTSRAAAARWVRCAVLPLLVCLVAGCAADNVSALTALPARRSAPDPPAATSVPSGAGPAITGAAHPPAAAPGTRVRLVSLTSGGTFGYLVGVPEHRAPAGGYPTIVYLHGLGERGDGSAAGLVGLEKAGLPQLAARSQLPATARGFLLLAPQTNAPTWSASSVHEWIRQMQRTYPIDPHRLYLTGVSMGGGGVVSYLDTLGPATGIAAAAPIAGDWTPARRVTGLPSCRRLGGTPIWAFAGDLDDVVPHQFSINLVAYLKNHCAGAGADRLTIFLGRFHDVWTHTYDLTGQTDDTDARFDAYSPDLFTWFLQHRLP